MEKALIRATQNDSITSKAGIKRGAMSDVFQDILIEPAIIDLFSGAAR
jgi:hypothetical protein